MKSTPPNNEFDALRDRGLTILSAIKEVYEPIGVDMKRLKPFKDVLLNTYKEKKKKPLKDVVRELEFWALELDPLVFATVHKLVYQKTGKIIGDESIFKTISAITRSGRIKNKKEYRVVSDYLTVFQDDHNRKTQIDKIAQLMADFEIQHRKKRK